jgi:hypothetical protein
MVPSTCPDSGETIGRVTTADPQARCPAGAALHPSHGLSSYHTHLRPTLEHDPEKWVPVFPRDKRGTRLRGDHAQIIKIERDDDSKKSHPVLAHSLAMFMRHAV